MYSFIRTSALMCSFIHTSCSIPCVLLQARYKQSLDPTVDEVKKLCTSLRRNAKEERVLFHYNGHGVPRPTHLHAGLVASVGPCKPAFAGALVDVHSLQVDVNSHRAPAREAEGWRRCQQNLQ